VHGGDSQVLGKWRFGIHLLQLLQDLQGILCFPESCRDIEEEGFFYDRIKRSDIFGFLDCTERFICPPLALIKGILLCFENQQIRQCDPGNGVTGPKIGRFSCDIEAISLFRRCHGDGQLGQPSRSKHRLPEFPQVETGLCGSSCKKET